MASLSKDLNSKITMKQLHDIEPNNSQRDIMLKRLLAAPYDYNAYVFNESLYDVNIEGNKFISFGSDLSGLYLFNEHDGDVSYLSEEDDEFKIYYCNSNIDLFVVSHDLFIALLHNVINFKVDVDAGVAALQEVYSKLDPKALDEDGFWCMRLFELGEGFFPLNDARVKFYQQN
ncbi:SUKH-4 family immunity protein [Cronobacter dublinensis]|uniref:SUKH-4 family immunity protein n=1 Tax=Cronobacter dublinensis TaxID=413497 RepID=UPI0023DD57E5|nr:SUKH-4 family immunity protein [Cronobacter dublinensis]MDT3665334.1 SUKH-4 family immunity protein [Cronobacter dublinensis]WEP47306.1 SUKH-4 family immunity protein [Cronobacter dublinensis]